MCSEKTGWQDAAPPIPKGRPMPRTQEYWEKRALMDQELILEQRDEISNLKRTINDLRQKLKAKHKKG